MIFKQLSIRESVIPALIILAGCFLLSSESHAKTLILSSYLAPQAPVSHAMREFASFVDSKTQGEDKFKIYYSGSLTTGKTTLSGIRNGSVDGGVVITGYVESSMPVTMIFQHLQFYNEDVRVTAAAVTDTMLNDCQACTDEFKSLGVHQLSPFAGSPYYTMCNGTFDNGFSPKGLRMRVTGEELARWVRKIGGNPVQMASSEEYQAIQRNALNCTLDSKIHLKTESLQEVVNTILDMPVGGFQGGSMLNVSEKIWHGLSDHQKEIFQKAAMYGLAKVTYIYWDQTAAVVDHARKKYNVKFVEPSSELKADREEFKNSEKENAIKTAIEKEVKDPSSIVNAYINNISKWKKIIETENPDEEQYAQLLVDEILKKPSK